jgi:hypothetical protein
MSPKGRWSRLFLVVFLFVWVCIPASANECVIETFKVRNISGTVLDENGDAIANAQIEVSKTKTDTIGHTLTDGSGIFYLPDIPAGKYELRVQAAGFQDGWLPIILDRPKKVIAGRGSLRIILTLGTGCTSASMRHR